MVLSTIYGDWGMVYCCFNHITFKQPQKFWALDTSHQFTIWGPQDPQSHSILSDTSKPSKSFRESCSWLDAAVTGHSWLRVYGSKTIKR